MKCFYHGSDLDGHCSGAIVKLKYPDCEMYPIDYGDPFPRYKIIELETIIMVDYGLQPDTKKLMSELAEMTNLIWIDHHKTTIIPELDFIGGVRKTDKAACQLTWKYFFPESNIPYAVELLGLYDIWDHRNSDVLPFQFGMRLWETDPCIEENMILWRRLLSRDLPTYAVQHFIHEGRICLKFISIENKKVCERSAFETEINGSKAIAINRGLTNSKLFDSIWNSNKYDLMITFWRMPNKMWTVSLYSDKENIDVSEIAKKYSGGGHKGAAGFQCEFLPFDI